MCQVWARLVLALMLAAIGLMGVAWTYPSPSSAAGALPPIRSGATPSPTRDRLAAPPTVANPSQADLGEQLFWLHCQPCHGDQGQGLTDDWRAQYPPEDQNCWKSGCHGQSPYANGFTLPTAVPALLGPGTLTRFATAADLYAFVSRTMPFQAPGSLQRDDYWALTAFLMRAHGLPDSAFPLEDEAAARSFPLGSPAQPPTATPESPSASASRALPVWAGLGLVVLLLGGLSVLAWRRRAGR